MELRQRARADGLGLVGQGLAVAQALRAAVQAVCAGQKLLPLLQLRILPGAGRVVGVPRPEEGGPVGGERVELALVLVHGGLEVAETLVDLGAGGRWDVGFLEAHLSELSHFVSTTVFAVFLMCTSGWPRDRLEGSQARLKR